MMMVEVAHAPDGSILGTLGIDLWRSAKAHLWLVETTGLGKWVARLGSKAAPPSSQLGAPSPTHLRRPSLFSLAHSEHHQHTALRCAPVGLWRAWILLRLDRAYI